jgi:hypothetical protein
MMARMKTRTAIFALLLLALGASAWAQEQAFINRSTELKEKAAADSKTLATLNENLSVKVLARGGAWTRVEANGQAGFVRVFHLRFPLTVEQAASSGGGGFLSGLTSALGGGRKTNNATIATTGIRGLSPEDLKNANPDPEALAKSQSYRADKPTAERFAREGKLVAVQVDVAESPAAEPTKGKRR